VIVDEGDELTRIAVLAVCGQDHAKGPEVRPSAKDVADGEADREIEQVAESPLLLHPSEHRSAAVVHLAESREVRAGDGRVELSLPAGRETIDLFAKTPQQEPRLTLSIGNERCELAGRRYDRIHAVWEQTYAGPAGRFRVEASPGLRLFINVQPAGDGPLAIRPGDVLRWYGPAVDSAVTLAS